MGVARASVNALTFVRSASSKPLLKDLIPKGRYALNVFGALWGDGASRGAMGGLAFSFSSRPSGREQQLLSDLFCTVQCLPCSSSFCSCRISRLSASISATPPSRFRSSLLKTRHCRLHSFISFNLSCARYPKPSTSFSKLRRPRFPDAILNPSRRPEIQQLIRKCTPQVSRRFRSLAGAEA